MGRPKKNIDPTFDIVEAKNQARENVIKQGKKIFRRCRGYSQTIRL